MCSNQYLDITRIKAIFSPKVHACVGLPSYLASLLVFVEYFAVCTDPTADQEGVVLSLTPPAHSLAVGPSSFYVVVPLTDIAHAVELVPMFETAIAGIDLSMDSCLEAYEQYYVNSFADKESFNVMC